MLLKESITNDLTSVLFSISRLVQHVSTNTSATVLQFAGFLQFACMPVAVNPD